MDARGRDIVAREIAAWGSLNELASVQEACAEAVSEIAAARRLGLPESELADAAAGLAKAAETMRQIVGAYEVERHIGIQLDSAEVSLELHRASHIQIGGTS
jgi:hypothetical protein